MFVIKAFCPETRKNVTRSMYHVTKIEKITEITSCLRIGGQAADTSRGREAMTNGRSDVSTAQAKS